MCEAGITKEKIVDILNELLNLDEEAVRKLIDNRVECNKSMANHPTVQVLLESKDEEKYSVGMLGIINGIIGKQTSGWGYIAAVYNVSCPQCDEPQETIGAVCTTCNEPAITGRLIKFTLLDKDGQLLEDDECQ